MEPIQTPIDEREIFTSGPVVVFKWRNAPGWPVEYVSRNVSDVFGHPTEAFLRGDIAYSELIHPDDLERVGREVQAACEGDVTAFTHQPYRMRRADGTWIWLYDHTNLVRDAAGVITHFHGYVIDITGQVEAEEENRRLEQQFLHAQKLESLGLLAGGLAHDFNNVLTGILGYAILTKRAQLAGKTEESLEAIGQVEALSLQAAELCRQLLAYSGRGKFVVRPLDLSQAVREVVGMLQMAVSKKTALRLDLPAGLPLVMADLSQLQQVIMNLVGNASDALGEAGGEIRVRISERELRPRELPSRSSASRIRSCPSCSAARSTRRRRSTPKSKARKRWGSSKSPIDSRTSQPRSAVCP
ncbi:MAG: PAS domain-containing protein [Planctomycetes bacterium]|nr:PAS domain-containing protein [Planctomycetota bacterium]